MLHRPELSGTVKAHLDFIIDDEDVVLIAGLPQPREVLGRRNYVAASSLHCLDVEGAVFGRLRFGVPHRVVLGLKLLRKLAVAIEVTGLTLHPINAAKAVGIKYKLGAFTEVTVAAPVAIAGGNGGSAERASMVPAHEGEHQVFAGVVAHDLKGILNGL